MANPEQLKVLRQGVSAWNEWRYQHPSIKPNLNGADLSGIHLSGAMLGEAHVIGAELVGADLNRADLSRADLGLVDLSGATLRGAKLGKTHLAGSKLRAADFGGADLCGADLSATDLSGAILGNANLTEADLNGANLSRATLVNANLRGADLTAADLRGAALINANLNWTTFNATGLKEADFSAAALRRTVFVAIDLRGVRGLETIVHEGPSGIGLDTIYLSAGDIPEVFLRGAGVPDLFITYMRSLAGTPIEFYSCFISYSTVDQVFAERLYADLQTNNVRCWFAAHDMAGGKKIHEQIDEAIRFHDKLLLILSPDSINSNWVKTEILKAFKREERDGRRVLFPIRLVDFRMLQEWEWFDSDSGEDVARKVREYFIPDFSVWKNHDSYHKAFQRLLKDLKAEKNQG